METLTGIVAGQKTDAQRQREFERENREIAARLIANGLPDVAKAYRRAADAHGECAVALESGQSANIPLARATRGEDACHLVELPSGCLGVSPVGRVATVIARPAVGKLVSDESVAAQMGPSWPTLHEWVDRWEDCLSRGGWAVTRYLMSIRAYREADWGAPWPAVTELQVIAMPARFWTARPSPRRTRWMISCGNGWTPRIRIAPVRWSCRATRLPSGSPPESRSRATRRRPGMDLRKGRVVPSGCSCKGSKDPCSCAGARARSSYCARARARRPA